MQGYVCGFLFSDDRATVLLIRKRRPAWQAGKLNGVGGKIEPGETPADAMRREFHEEAGVDRAAWHHRLTLTGPDWVGHFFRAFGDLSAARSVTDEQLEQHPVRALPAHTIPNLQWIIPLLLDEDALRGAYVVDVDHATPLEPGVQTSAIVACSGHGR
ncbi:MAG TPA: NUDIX domain-containing protein [Tepidisphaeraceae bacterium]|nr:NUDIX domain-containing protein [Tepidisphaeraceae bacterium]